MLIFTLKLIITINWIAQANIKLELLWSNNIQLKIYVYANN